MFINIKILILMLSTFRNPGIFVHVIWMNVKRRKIGWKKIFPWCGKLVYLVSKSCSIININII